MLCRCGAAVVRTPTSDPLVWIRAGILGVAVGNGLSGEIGFLSLRCAARVVAVKTESALHIELRLGPGPENQTRFGFADGPVRVGRQRVWPKVSASLAGLY